jgi:membrane protein
MIDREDVTSQLDKVRRFLREVWDILWDCIHRFGDHDCMQLSAGIAYYSLLSMFPLVMLLVSVASFFFSPDEATTWLVDRVGNNLQVSEGDLTSAFQGAVQSRGPVGVVGVVGLAIGSTAALGAMIRSINRAWGFSGRIPRSFVRSKLWEFALLGSVLVLFLLSFAATGFMEGMGRHPWWGFVLHVVPFGLVIGVFLVLYKLLPATHVSWRDIWLPSVLAAAAFEIAKRIFTWYVGTLANYNAIYGGLATIMLLLLWVYLSAAILLFGAELGSVLATRRGRGIDD